MATAAVAAEALVGAAVAPGSVVAACSCLVGCSLSKPGFLAASAFGVFDAATAGLAALLAGITEGTTVADAADATAATVATVATVDDEAGTGGATATDEAVPSAPDAAFDAASNGPDACAATSVAGLDPDNILKVIPATASKTAAATHNIPLFLAGADGSDDVGADVGASVGSGVKVAGAAAPSSPIFGSAVTSAEGTVASEGSGGVASAVVVAVLGSITVLSFACASVIGRRGTS